MLAGNASGNPAFVASPITWSAGFIDHHLVVLNAVFAIIQLALGLGIAWRPAVKVALAASVAWSLGVWWFGEGLGGVLAGTASPVRRRPRSGHPLRAARGPALARRPGCRRAVRRRPRRRPSRSAARSWLVVWGSMAFFALLPASRAPQAFSDMISAMAPGEPGWLGLDRHPRRQRAPRPGPARLDRARVQSSPWWPRASTSRPGPSGRSSSWPSRWLPPCGWPRAWAAIFTGSGTDPNTGPLLALFALAFWPAARDQG